MDLIGILFQFFSVQPNQNIFFLISASTILFFLLCYFIIKNIQGGGNNINIKWIFLAYFISLSIFYIILLPVILIPLFIIVYLVINSITKKIKNNSGDVYNILFGSLSSIIVFFLCFWNIFLIVLLIPFIGNAPFPIPFISWGFELAYEYKIPIVIFSLLSILPFVLLNSILVVSSKNKYSKMGLCLGYFFSPLILVPVFLGYSSYIVTEGTYMDQYKTEENIKRNMSIDEIRVVCLKESGSYFQSYCFKDFAKIKKDESICDEIIEDKYGNKNECRKEVEIYIEDSSFLNF